MCRALKVSRSGYYSWKNRKDSARKKEDKKLAPTLCSVFDETKRVYGCVRMSKAMEELGFFIGKSRMVRLMNENNLVPQKPKWKPWGLSKPDKSGRFSPDLVKREFSATRPDELWTSDITWIFTGEGLLYLAVILDVFSRYIVGWALREDETAELVIEAFNMACGRRNVPEGMIFHSDKGGQYCDMVLRKELEKLGIRQSMNGHSGAWFDNAITESVIATIKKECVYKEDFITGTKKMAQEKLFDYIELFYNPKRLHSALDYMSPVEFEMVNKL